MNIPDEVTKAKNEERVLVAEAKGLWAQYKVEILTIAAAAFVLGLCAHALFSRH